MIGEKFTLMQYPVHAILGLIDAGQFVIPEIQRPFVWKRKQVRDLIDSLYNGYPTGYIITWKNPDVKTKDGTIAGGKHVLIDGQQRITALMAAISGLSVLDQDFNQDRIRIAFNPLATDPTKRFEVQDASHLKDKKWIPDISVLFKPDFRQRAFENQYAACNEGVDLDEVSEAIEYVGKVDPEGHEGIYSNSWYSYSMITARKLGAEINNNAQGGIAVLDGTGYFNPSLGYIGLESTYDKLRYSRELGKCNEWDFSRYTPHVVIMALGQNDSHPVDYINDDIEKREYWKNKYKEIILDLRSKYPNALFIIITTLLCHNEGWDIALDEMAKDINDDKIVRFKFKRNGIGTPGHLRILEAEEMAEELTKFIESFGEKIWN